VLVLVLVRRARAACSCGVLVLLGEGSSPWLPSAERHGATTAPGGPGRGRLGDQTLDNGERPFGGQL